MSHVSSEMATRQCLVSRPFRTALPRLCRSATPLPHGIVLPCERIEPHVCHHYFLALSFWNFFGHKRNIKKAPLSVTRKTRPLLVFFTRLSFVRKYDTVQHNALKDSIGSIAAYSNATRSRSPNMGLSTGSTCARLCPNHHRASFKAGTAAAYIPRDE